LELVNNSNRRDPRWTKTNHDNNRII